MPAKDLTGKKTNRLTAVRARPDLPKLSESIMWECRCECGKTCFVSASKFGSGKALSCGCKRFESTGPSDLSGKRFGKLFVIRLEKRATRWGNGSRRGCTWVCRCDCGAIKTVIGAQLKNGSVRSCGCLRAETTRTQNGESETNLYRIWRGMIYRCYSPKSGSYRLYGGRGIAVCDRWKDSLQAFKADMGDRPTLEHSLDRIDNSKGYSPDNCRWALKETQQRNKRTNRKLTAFGQTKCVAEWAELRGISQSRILSRLRLGWNAEDAINRPPRITKLTKISHAA